MLSNKATKQGHKGIALEMVFISMFASIGETRSIAIIIDKHKTSLNAINKVVEKDAYCWNILSGKRIQVTKRALLCHFHVMKAWKENLFI
jgi:hypothetical protein